MSDCCPKRMSRTVGAGDGGNSGKILSRDKPKRMSRSASGSTPAAGNSTTPIELKHTNWRHKTREDPKEVEYKKMMSSMGFANL